ncbi:MAG TPA: hypothetical protein VNM91_08190 [Dehalococcoidia bacterium]|nr:hypothetical protein [Dehalococcoidia bacterium]
MAEDMAAELERRVDELKEIIAGNDGRNAADARFARTVDNLVRAVYEDIGQIARIPARTLFDLFVIKVLYVGRQSSDAAVVDYLARLLERCIDIRQVFPSGPDGRPRTMYFSDMLDPQRHPADVPNVFEAYRRYADAALFLSGVFPASLGRRRPGGPSALRRRAAPTVDPAYYATTGKTMYRMAAFDDHSGCEHDPETLRKLSDYFDVYADALNEMSERYIVGFDMSAIADRMLDSFNRYRTLADERARADAHRYAHLLGADPTWLAHER